MRKLTFLFLLTLFNTVALARIGLLPSAYLLSQQAAQTVSTQRQTAAVDLLLTECPAIKSQPDGKAAIHSIAAAIDLASSKYGLEPELLAAVIVTESRCRANARSRAGAMGLMQLMPGTASWLGLERPFETHHNVDAGAKYLSMLIAKFEGDLELALAAYNAGPSRAKSGRVREAKAYVRKVKARYEGFRQQTGSREA